MQDARSGAFVAMRKALVDNGLPGYEIGETIGRTVGVLHVEAEGRYLCIAYQLHDDIAPDQNEAQMIARALQT